MGDKDLEDPFESITSDTYFTSINVEATLNILHELALEFANRGELDDENKTEFEAIENNISELSRQRNELHDLLEIETINANKKRRALQVLPKSYNSQLRDAVAAARQQNAEKILTLQKKLKSLKENVGSMEKRMQILNSENVALKPECEIIRKEHDQIIAQLNHRMSIKSSKQIVLNETCDVLRDVHQQTSDIDVGLENLAEDLEQDKAEAAAVKDDLLKETKETEEKISEVKDKINEEKKILNKLMEQSTEKSIEIQERNKVISRLENSVTRLQLDGMQISNKIEREKRGNQNTIAEINKLNQVKERDLLMYQDKIDRIQKKLKQVLAERETVDIECSETFRIKQECDEAKHDSLMRKKELLQGGKEAARDVEWFKNQLSQKVEEVGEITLRNNEIQEQMKELEENHRATVELYQSQTEELTEHLNKEQGERVKVQIQREESEKHLETFRSEETKFINNITIRINSAANEHQQLSDKSLSLSRETKKKKQEISNLKVKLEVAHGSYRSMKSSLNVDLERLRKSVVILKEEIGRKRIYADEKIPLIAEMRKKSEMMSEEYNESKNKMLAIRNQEKSVLDQKNRTKILADKIRKAVSEVKVKVELSRKKCLEQLKKEREDRDCLEGQINDVIFRLETLHKSNTKFQIAHDDIEDDFDELMIAMNSHASRQHQLLKQFKEIQEMFNNSWLTTVGMEKDSADHDAKLLKDIHRIQQDAEERSITLTEIVKLMEHDLEQLANFTDNVSRRRPKDTRQSRRKVKFHSGAKPKTPKPPDVVRQFKSSPGIPVRSLTAPPAGFENRRRIKSAHLQATAQHSLAVETPGVADAFMTQTAVKAV